MKEIITYIICAIILSFGLLICIGGLLFSITTAKVLMGMGIPSIIAIFIAELATILIAMGIIIATGILILIIASAIQDIIKWIKSRRQGRGA